MKFNYLDRMNCLEIIDKEQTIFLDHRSYSEIVVFIFLGSSDCNDLHPCSTCEGETFEVGISL